MPYTFQWTACRRLWYGVFDYPDKPNHDITGYLSYIYYVGRIARHGLVIRRLRCLLPVATLKGDINGPSDQSCRSDAICSVDNSGMETHQESTATSSEIENFDKRSEEYYFYPEVPDEKSARVASVAIRFVRPYGM